MKDDMDIGRWTDEQLLESITRGSAAERVLYQRHSAYVINLASRFLRNRARAEEVAQDVWLALHQYLQKRCPPAAFKPYLAAMVVNRCRKLSKNLHDDVSLDAALLAQLERSELHSVTAEDGASRTMEQGYLMAAVSERLRGLSNAGYMAIKLRYFDECSYAEIAATLGKTESYARFVTHRALKVLKKEFAERKNKP